MPTTGMRPWTRRKIPGDGPLYRDPCFIRGRASCLKYTTGHSVQYQHPRDSAKKYRGKPSPSGISSVEIALSQGLCVLCLYLPCGRVAGAGEWRVSSGVRLSSQSQFCSCRAGQRGAISTTEQPDCTTRHITLTRKLNFNYQVPNGKFRGFPQAEQRTDGAFLGSWYVRGPIRDPT